MLKLIKYLKPYTVLLALMLVFTCVQVVASLQLPDLMAKIVNDGIVGQNQDLIWNIGIEMLLVTVLGAVCTIIVSFLASKVGIGFARDLRARVFSKVENFSLTEFNKFSTASLITRSTNDVSQVQQVLIMIFRMVLSAPITAVVAIVKAYQTAPSMTWIMGVAIVVLLTLIVSLFSVAIPKFTVLQKLVDKLNLVAREGLTGLRVIRAFNTQKIEEKKFENVNIDLTKTNLFVNRLTTLMQPMMMLILNITMISIIWIGSHLISTNDLRIGDMLAFMQYSMQVIFAFLMISIIFIMVPRAAVSGDRIMEVLEIEPLIKNPKNPKTSASKTKGLIEFKSVWFTYPGADTAVLEDISFTANPGETTAFIGSTGSGKSTLINLIPRFYDVSSGEIMVDGINIKDVNQEDLRDKIGYVPQKGVLFSGNIESNIKYGKPDASEEDIQKAIETAQASEFVSKLEAQTGSSISQGGTNVSGGQKQRLSIARALIKKPEIYIFDDSFSALDFKTDAALRKALKQETQHSTVLIVAQRIGTIIHADKIIVLNEGKIVGIGKHEELMKSCKVYKEIALSQLSEKELGKAL
jgi:ATP-binding cassette subfamily B multidrug efflux pump